MWPPNKIDCMSLTYELILAQEGAEVKNYACDYASKVFRRVINHRRITIMSAIASNPAEIANENAFRK